jgi:hypothetical protein
MEVPEEARMEIKFVAYRTDINTIERWLALHPLAFSLAHPDRHINNVYFDNFDYRAYAENLSGASERNKVRYRWYGNHIEPAAGCLEIKRKRNYFGWKEKYKVSKAPYRPNANWATIREEIETQITPRGSIWLADNPAPMIINRYVRRYFVSSCQRLRATIDWDQAVWDQRYQSQPNFNIKAHLPDTVVVELKFARDERELASAAIQGIPLRVGRHSKYMNAIRAVAN